MVLKQTYRQMTRGNEPRKFYACSQWPKCKGTHGAHPDGEPLGTPADALTGKARSRVHKVAGKIWGKWEKSSRAQRQKMYDWMVRNAPKEHIADMTVDECEITIHRLEQDFDIKE